MPIDITAKVQSAERIAQINSRLIAITNRNTDYSFPEVLQKLRESRIISQGRTEIIQAMRYMYGRRSARIIDSDFEVVIERVGLRFRVMKSCYSLDDDTLYGPRSYRRN